MPFATVPPSTSFTSIRCSRSIFSCPKPASTPSRSACARKEVIAEGVRPFYLSSPEDIILNKLEWYKMGEQISTRQWNDLVGVIKRQSTALDLPYLQLWARELRVADLLARALREGGLK
jgi:hypothetical protein